MKQPKVVRRVPPIYPLQLRASGIRGDVLVEFVVNSQGRVEEERIVRSLNAYFDEAALEAVRQWRFEPGLVDGQPVKVRMQQPIQFSLFGEADGGQDGMEIRRRADLSKVPEELRYDTPPKPRTLVTPVFPYELLRQGKSGSAQVSYVIGANGRVLVSSVVEAKHPQLGLALQAAVELFAYDPALKNGQAIRSILGFEQDFDYSDERIFSPQTRAALRLEEKHPERIVKSSSLDQAIKPLTRETPAYPGDLREQRVPGKAVVEFLINESGQVCLPRVVSATAPAFGYAAVQAMSKWRFAAPLSAGKPVVVRARVPFVFEPPAEPTASVSENKSKATTP